VHSQDFTAPPIMKKDYNNKSFSYRGFVIRRGSSCHRNLYKCIGAPGEKDRRRPSHPLQIIDEEIAEFLHDRFALPLFGAHQDDLPATF